MPTNDCVDSLREYLPAVGELTKYIPGIYVESVVDSTEFVCVIDKELWAVEHDLVRAGFQRNPVAAYKRLENSDAREASNWRKKYPQGKQLHIVLFREAGGVGVYAHYEWAWDEAPLKHYQGKDVEDTRGAAIAEKELQKYYADTYDTLINGRP
jgi:hypothetical protein